MKNIVVCEKKNEIWILLVAKYNFKVYERRLISEWWIDKIKKRNSQKLKRSSFRNELQNIAYYDDDDIIH